MRLARGETRLPRHFIYCTKAGPGDVFRQFAERARKEPGWTCDELPSSHNPHVTMPEELARLIGRLVSRAA